ncbi:Tryptophan-rich sensory protein [Gordonia insulae]|uniref:Tryptophan-rich sensory protein n=1 Tax=Gordonia insulae TaxID=2420509 RepID=A0A3G8JIZ8_9ACTN|nr:Tryptophan-rich sensory protein [Gordonia insulae]
MASAAAAALGSVVTKSAVQTWYPTLRKPAFTPPNWVFPVAWTTLYADVAVTSAATIDRLDDAGDDSGRRAYLGALGANLALNAGWTWVYFGAHRLGAASVVAGALAVSSADLARRTAQVDARSGAALAAYPAWCAFATVLSTSTWWLNRDR